MLILDLGVQGPLLGRAVMAACRLGPTLGQKSACSRKPKAIWGGGQGGVMLGSGALVCEPELVDMTLFFKMERLLPPLLLCSSGRFMVPEI